MRATLCTDVANVSEGERPTRQWVRWLMLIVAVGLLAIFARSVDWTRAWDAIVQADPALLGVATVANLASLAVKVSPVSGKQCARRSPARR